MSLAKAFISGILINEPEKRFTPNDIGVTTFMIQVAPTGRQETAFNVRVTCWRNLADIAAQNLHKGDCVTLEGRLQINQYESPDGLVKRMFEVDANNLYLGQLQPLANLSEMSVNQNAPSQKSYGSASSFTQPEKQPVPAGTTATGSMDSSILNSDFLTENDIPF